jgi:hypothetical protein
MPNYRPTNRLYYQERKGRKMKKQHIPTGLLDPFYLRDEDQAIMIYKTKYGYEINYIDKKMRHKSFRLEVIGKIIY